MNDTSHPDAGLLQVNAPHRELLDQVLDKWSIQVLDVLCGRPMRFNELRREIRVVGQKSLTTTLRRLERNGMVERVVIATRPFGVEYRIAPIGDTLNELIDALLRWTTANMPEVERARARFDDVDET
ncbi:MarR family transcriptional regulator [Cryobacterium roopkundense]|uniref:DNA-binding HxlR family transcriptional regulator n=1 Tax=Cryobacterium roopkundense TaxID=1001240 RepID=A0A099JER1_9MICO|nr:helix-turn-helix domain-containing protein [Cryobacterium roopkundense]KGJ76969.1 MarR family transcriptional regulator [Cryobacterium roopkundense]MBB5640519.1 DNA-binding HxlR family transcriptional regulator [Cryobacterium roopkundense]